MISITSQCKCKGNRCGKIRGRQHKGLNQLDINTNAVSTSVFGQSFLLNELSITVVAFFSDSNFFIFYVFIYYTALTAPLCFAGIWIFGSV